MQYLSQLEKNAPPGRFSLGHRAPILVATAFVGGWLTTSHITPWVSWHAEAPFFLAMLVAAWIGVWRLGCQFPRTCIAFPPPVWPLVMLLGAIFLQYVTGQIAFLGDVVVFALYVALCVVSLALGFASTQSNTARCLLERPPSPMALLSATLVFGGLASVVVALAQVLEVWDASPWILRMPSARRPGGNLGQPNHLTTLLVMALASAVFLHASKRMGHFATALVVTTLCAGLAITESRTGALSLFALLLWWGWKQPVVSPQASRWWAVGVGLLFMAMFQAWPALLGVIQGTPGMLRARMGSGAVEARMDVWPQLIEAALQRPWVGWGIRQTAEAHNAVAHAYSFSLPFSYSHNLLIDLVLWVGVPTTSVLVIMTTVWLWRRTRVIQSPVPWYGFAVALPLAVHSMLEFPFAYAYFLAPAMLGLGAMEGALGTQTKTRLGLKAATGLLLLTSVLTVWSAVEYLRAEEDFRVARFELLRIGHTPDDYDRPSIILLTQLGALADATRIEPEFGMPAEDLDLLKKVALHYPWSGTQYRYALALALNDHPIEAARQLRVLRAQHGEKTYLKLRAQIEVKLAESNASGARLSLP